MNLERSWKKFSIGRAVSYSEHYNVIVSSSQQCTIKIKDYVIMTSLIHNVHGHAVQEPIHRDGLNKL